LLYLVPTPVGNLEDITLRALRILKEVDLIACEDTRTSGILLSHFGIETPRTSYHDHNEARKAPRLVERMAAGQQIALVTDAGSPGISDPGFYLVRACVEAGIRVNALPGPTAFVPALAASGLPCERFVFEGFLPARKGRQKRLHLLKTESRTMVFYESPHRLVKTLANFAEVFGPDHRAVVARELSKKFEEVHRGTLAELQTGFSEQTKVRGEIVLIIEGVRPEKQQRDKYPRDNV